MKAKELIIELQKLSPEQQELPVEFYDDCGPVEVTKVDQETGRYYSNNQTIEYQLIALS